MDNTTNTAGEALDLNKTRAEFEAWAEGYFMCFVLHKAGEGYASTMTQAAWEAWCAALARAGSAAPAGQQAEPIYQTMEGEHGEYWQDTNKAGFDAANAEFINTRIVYAAPVNAAPVAPTAELIELGNRLANTVEVVAPTMLNAGTTECLKRLVSEWREALAAPNAAVQPPLMRQAVASVVSRVGEEFRIGWLRPERVQVGTLLYCAAEPIAAQPKDTTDTRRDA